MTGLTHHFATMAYNNAWANHRLLGACAQLTQEELTATRTSFFPTIRATLNHNLTVDWRYLDDLERAVRGQEVNPEPWKFYEPEEPFAACAELAAAQRAADRRLIELCVALTEPQLDLPVPVMRRVGLHIEPLTRLLAHLLQHQIHHRGQAHAMLAGTRIAPPQLDEFFCVGDAPLREADLAALGTSEAQIWRS